MSKKKGSSFVEKFESFARTIARPLEKFTKINGVAAAIEGISSNMNVIMAGSIFVILFVLSSPTTTGTGKAIIPFLEPLSDKFMVVNSYTLGVLALISSASIAIAYAKRVGMDTNSAVSISIVTLLMLCFNDGTIDITYLGAKGLIVSMFSSVWSVKIYKFFIDKNITFKLPDSVPEIIGKSFSAFIPTTVIIALAWIVRTVLDFDLVSYVYNLTAPLLSSSESIPFTVFLNFISGCFWTIGIHGDNMISAIKTPITQTFLEENVAAFAAGTPISQLPHWYNGFLLSGTFFFAYWPVVIYMLISKYKENRKVGIACAIPLIFNIIEPVIFGIPMVLNPYLLIPLLVCTLWSDILCGFAFKYNFIANKVVASVPWALPLPLQQLIAFNGELSIFILGFVILAINMIIYLPFFKIYEAKRHEEASNKQDKEAISNENLDSVTGGSDIELKHAEFNGQIENREDNN